MPNFEMSSRQRTKSRSPSPAPIVRPSGRFDALVDMGNPMKGAVLFPYLRRRVEGRALGGVGPVADLEVARTTREVSVIRRWPREVSCLCHLSWFFLRNQPVAHVSQVQGDWHYGPLLGEGNRPFKGPKLLALTPDGAHCVSAV